MGAQGHDATDAPTAGSPALGDSFAASRSSESTLELLNTRRSTLARLICPPGPSRAELDGILRIGARVPDHRRLQPWRFLVILGAERERLHDRLSEIYTETQPTLSDEEREKGLEKISSFARAPVTICIVSATKNDSGKARKTPLWEQQLSAGAACQNLLIAASASGYAAQWVTEWCAYDPLVQRTLGLAEGEQIAGFVFIGTATQNPLERKRPESGQVVEYWTAGSGSN